MIPRGVRARLMVTVIGLVALTSLVLGIGAYAYVATSLRAQQLSAARELTDFNVAVLATERLPADATRSDLASSRLLDGFASRGIVGTIVDFGDADPYASNLVAAGAVDLLAPALRTAVARGDVGYQRVRLGTRPLLITGARRPPSGPDFYFLFDASGVETAIDQLARAIAVVGLLLMAVAALTAGWVARRLLRPVGTAAGAAERIAGGDLSARLVVTSADEFGQLAASFNRMAAALEQEVLQLERAQAREQRFVADVSHELRTPLTALVGEASLLRAHLPGLPAPARRAGELLLADVGRLRSLVDDLIEVSRFDAGAERLETDEVDLGTFVRSLTRARLPGAGVDGPLEPAVVITDRRRLERVLGNLLDNARLHGEARDVEVTVRLDHAEGGQAQLTLAVGDRGPGVGVDDLSRIFERFHKVDPSRHRGGSGLGLAIAREHARLLGGSLEASLRAGGGLLVTLRAPVTRLLPAGNVAATSDGHPAALQEARTESH